jgi:hypothetical protein
MTGMRTYRVAETKARRDAAIETGMIRLID